MIDDTFGTALHPIWDVTQIGTGTVTGRDDGLWLTVSSAETGYSNAQIADYTYPPQGFRWRPPLRMTVTARASHSGRDLVGTAGFGFWNHPFSPDVKRLPRLPRAVWFFFASPPSDMQLARGVPGNGWKASSIDATGARALTLIPLAVPLMLAMRSQAGYQRLWGGIQNRLRISEQPLDADLLRERHTYSLEWQQTGVTFWVDGVAVHSSPLAPRGDAGFVAWMDNQYAIATPQGRFGFGLIPVKQEQSLILEQVKIEPL